MSYNSLAVSLFRKCSASCSICCFESTPDKTERLEIEPLKKYILSSKQLSYIKEISFTGGEPFLEYSLLKDLVSFSKNIGKTCTCVTNAFWADNLNDTEECIMELKNSGLVKLTVSYDEFHSEFVKPQNIINVMKACKKIGLFLSLSIIKSSKTHQIIDELDNDILDVPLSIHSPFYVGGAKKNNISSIQTRENKQLKCPYNGSFTLVYDGNIWPCCSPSFVETAIELGNYHCGDVSESLRTIRKHGILHIIKRFGFDFFNQEAKNLGFDVPEYVASPCELCALYFNKNNIHLFHEAVGRKVKEIVNTVNIA